MASIQPGSARAQETEETDDGVDRIVVTGTRIPTSILNTPIPTRILDGGEIEEAGSISLGEILTQLPGVNFDLSPENTETNTQNSGLSTVDLRNLGANRTLTLIDGRRAISNSANSQRVSLSTVPSDFVDRVEIITGGASAVYGSDAVAGVVNIILKDDFDGLEYGARLGGAEAGGEDEFTYAITAGRNFADGRGNVMLNFTWDEESIVRGRDRDFALRAVEFDDGDLVTELSGILPGGRFEGNDAWHDRFGWHNDQSLPPAGETTPRDFDADIDGFNLRPFRTISPAIDRWLLAGKAHFDLLPDLRAFVSAQYNFQHSLSFREPQTAASTTDYGPLDIFEIGQLPSSHPFIPAEVEETRIGSVSWQRRFSELGSARTESDRRTLRLWAGFEGYVFSDWRFEASYGYGRFTQDQLRSGEINFQNLDFGLDIEADPDNPGGFRCVDAGARAAGCVPVNIFGEGSITPEMAAYIEAVDNTFTELKQHVVAAHIAGDLFQLPAGPVSAAVGIEYRKEQQVTDGDPVTQTEVTGFSFIADLAGEYDVFEEFAELNIPLLRDKPFVHSLGFQTAARVAHYSQENVGTVVSYKFGGHWAPLEDFRLRAQFARAQRAPDITELFSPERGDADNVDDPCDGVTAVSTGEFDDNCRADPDVAAIIALDGFFEQEAEQIFGPNSGNPNLEEETADTFTVGGVFTPRFLPDFSLVVDYYRISVKGAIAAISSQDAADLCYGAANFPNNDFCDVITRNNEGQIVRIVNQEQNLNELLASGIDITANYEFEFGNTIPGSFDITFLYSWIEDLETRFDGPDGPEVSREAGEVGNSRHQWRATLGWSHEGFRVRWRTKYLSGAADDVDEDPSDPEYFEVDPWARHDIYLHYVFHEDPRVRIFAGVQNLFDDHGPFLPTGANSGNLRNFNSAYDPIGRFFYGGIKVSW